MICERCGKEHDGSYGSGRFCSEFCARSSASITNKPKQIRTTCIYCNKEITVNKHASKTSFICNECKEKRLHDINTVSKSKVLTCNICGRKYTKYDGGCKNEFCRNHKLTELNNLIKYFGFNQNKLKTIDVEKEYERIAAVLYHLYHDEQKSYSDIAKIFNYPGNAGNLTKVFQKLDIPTRSFSEAGLLAVYNGKHKIYTNPKYKHGWHTTWNGKEVYLRSSYEFNYALELDNKQINYEVESLKIKYFDTQKNQLRCAIPDFYLPDTNEIIEIKSIWTLDKQNMIDRFIAFKELGYNCKCICDGEEINI